jgi:hypothetical protein
MPLYAVLAREYFGQEIMGTVFGAATMISSIGMAFCPRAGDWVFDSFATYRALSRLVRRRARRRRHRTRVCTVAGAAVRSIAAGLSGPDARGADRVTCVGGAAGGALGEQPLQEPAGATRQTGEA